MAVDDDGEFCGSCNKSFKDGDLSVNCDLYCNRWFHIKCVGIVKNDYDKMQSLGNHNKWFCTPCEKTFLKRKDEKVCCDCFSYISILTDSIKELSDNQKEMSHNLSRVMLEQKDMRKCIKEDDAATANVTSDMGTNQRKSSLEVSEGTKDHAGDGFYMFGAQGKEENYGYNDDIDIDRDNSEAACHVQSEVISPKQVNSNTRPDVFWKEVNYRNSRGSRSRRGHPNSRVYSNNQVMLNNYHNVKPRPNLDRSNQQHQVGGRTSFEPIVTRPRPESNSVMTRSNGPHRESNKPSYSQVAKTSVTNKVIRGSMETVETGPKALKTAKRMFWLFLSGLDPEVDVDAVRAYLSSLNVSTSYVCEKLKTKYDTYSSFKVGIPYELASELMHPNLWPQGCIVCKYKAPRLKPSTDFLDHASQSCTQT